MKHHPEARRRTGHMESDGQRLDLPNITGIFGNRAVAGKLPHTGDIQDDFLVPSLRLLECADDLHSWQSMYERKSAMWK